MSCSGFHGAAVMCSQGHFGKALYSNSVCCPVEWRIIPLMLVLCMNQLCYPFSSILPHLLPSVSPQYRIMEWLGLERTRAMCSPFSFCSKSLVWKHRRCKPLVRTDEGFWTGYTSISRLTLMNILASGLNFNLSPSLSLLQIDRKANKFIPFCSGRDWQTPSILLNHFALIRNCWLWYFSNKQFFNIKCRYFSSCD